MKIRKFLTTCVMMFLALLNVQIVTNAAEVISVKGSVQIQSAAVSDWKQAEKGMQLVIGDMIRTARNSVAEVALDAEKKNTIRVEPKTMVTLNSATANTIDRLDLAKGKVYANLENIKAGLSFEVNTPSAVAGVRGSALSVYVERDSDEIVAYKDTVFVKAYNIDKQLISEVMLPEGFKTMVERFAEPSVFYQISSREFKHFDSKMDDLSANIEGKTTARAAAEEARKAQASKNQFDDQASEQEQIIQDVVDTKDIQEDSKTTETIEDLRLSEEPYMP